MKLNGVATVAVKKDICCKCNLTFGLAEKRVAIDPTRVMHEDCYEKHLHDLAARAERIQVYARNVH